MADKNRLRFPVVIMVAGFKQGRIAYLKMVVLAGLQRSRRVTRVSKSRVDYMIYIEGGRYVAHIRVGANHVQRYGEYMVRYIFVDGQTDLIDSMGYCEEGIAEFSFPLIFNRLDWHNDVSLGGLNFLSFCHDVVHYAGASSKNLNLYGKIFKVMGKVNATVAVGLGPMKFHEDAVVVLEFCRLEICEASSERGPSGFGLKTSEGIVRLI